MFPAQVEQLDSETHFASVPYRMLESVLASMGGLLGTWVLTFNIFGNPRGHVLPILCQCVYDL